MEFERGRKSYGEHCDLSGNAADNEVRKHYDDYEAFIIAFTGIYELHRGNHFALLPGTSLCDKLWLCKAQDQLINYTLHHHL